MRKNRNDQLFGKIFFFPVMTKKRSKQKNIAVLPVAKPYLFNMLLREKSVKKP